jgi:hypothetical protein
MHFTADSDIKTIMMKDYERKNALLKKWHGMLKEGKREEFEALFPAFKPHFWHAQLIQAMHGLQIYLFMSLFGVWPQFLKFATYFFVLIAVSHTIGSFLNTTSMESVPFETAIKAILMRVSAKHSKHKESAVKSTKVL